MTSKTWSQRAAFSRAASCIASHIRLSWSERSSENIKLCTPLSRSKSPAILFLSLPVHPRTPYRWWLAEPLFQFSLLCWRLGGERGEEDVLDTEPVAVLPWQQIRCYTLELCSDKLSLTRTGRRRLVFTEHCYSEMLRLNHNFFICPSILCSTGGRAKGESGRNLVFP